MAGVLFVLPIFHLLQILGLARHPPLVALYLCHGAALKQPRGVVGLSPES